MINPGKGVIADVTARAAVTGDERSGARRRGDVLIGAIFDAVIKLLREEGYEGVTMHRAAAAAGTGKSALYRRWGNRDELVLDALTSVLPRPEEVALIGDARTDLLTLGRVLLHAFDLSQDTAFRAAKRGMEDGMAPVVQERVVEPVRARILEVVRAGVAAGKLRVDAATEQTASVIPAMLVYRFVTGGPDIPVGYLEEIVDGVMLPLIRTR